MERWQIGAAPFVSWSLFEAFEKFDLRAAPTRRVRLSQSRLFTDYLDSFGEANRAQINELLLPKLSDALDHEKKINKISNLLTKLRRRGVIFNAGVDSASRWMLAEKK
ncbi:hypothetical protein [Microbulbifer sp.]|uniref:hypothetical protein n=1 Tax=Microbulbifer sp. TaxID=1908541 RepID=UPI003F2A8591